MALVKLFTNPYSPYGQRVQIALTEKGIPFERIMVDPHNKPQELLDANPIHKKIPTIIHDGKPVPESLVILEYLEDVFPGQVPLLPADAYERARVRFWADYIENHGYKLAFFPSFNSMPESPEKLTALENCKKVFKTLEDAMISFSAEGPFFTGATFGYLDAILGPISAFGLVFEHISGYSFPSRDELPRFNSWLEAAQAHPSVKATTGSPETTFETISALFKARDAAAATH